MISGAFQVTFRNCFWSCVTQLLCEDEPCGALRWWHRTKQDFNFPGSSDLITGTDGICNTDVQAGKKAARVWDIVQAPAYVEIRQIWNGTLFPEGICSQSRCEWIFPLRWESSLQSLSPENEKAFHYDRLFAWWIRFPRVTLTKHCNQLALCSPCRTWLVLCSNPSLKWHESLDTGRTCKLLAAVGRQC